MDDDVRDAQADQTDHPAGEQGKQNEPEAQEEADSAARRHAALSALAQSQSQRRQAENVATPVAPASATPQRRAPRRGALISFVVAAVAIIAIIAIVAIIAVIMPNLAGMRSQKTGAAPTTPPVSNPIVRINPLGDGLDCVNEIAWSPDSAQIAVLGNTDRCGASSEGEQSTGIYLYDARTGKLAQQLQPDLSIFGSSAIQDAIIKSESNSYNTPELSYTTLVWTPDGKALLLPYQIETSGPNDKVATYVTGLLRLGIQSSASTSVWLDTTHPQQTRVPERWDLATGRPVTPSPPGAASDYSWASDGSLATATAPADGAIGNTAGGQSFSVWQPGYLLYQLSSGNLANTGASSSAPVKGDVGWSTTIMPLSPDGRYLDTYVAYAFDSFDSLTPPSTQHVLPSEATLAPHDAALLALARQMTQATGDLTQQPGYAVAWRPDGKRMAAVSLNANVANTATPPSAFTVTVYDTSSGQVVKRFTPDWSGLSTRDSSLEMAQWSPDGKRLLLEDNVFGAITIWGPGALPA